MELNTELGDKRAQAANLAGISNAYVLLGETKEALDRVTEALKLSIETSDADLLSRLFVIRGDIYRELGQIEVARDDYANAARQLEQIRVSLHEERHLIGFLTRDRTEVYSRLIQTLLVMRNTSDAFEVVQQAKSRALIQLLSRSRFVPSVRINKDLVDREQELQSTMNAYMAMASQATDEGERLHWSAKVTDVSNELNDVWDVLHKSSEEYVDLRRAVPLSMIDFRRLCSLSA